MKYDLVITWVNWCNEFFIKKLREAGHRGESCTNGEFVELKYLLRSLEKHNIHPRKIFIIHSDNHPPPPYLKEVHNLKFVKHSELVTDKKHLPLVQRQAIWTHLHKIPDLTNLFFYMEDDYFIMNGKIFDTLLDNYKNNTVFIDDRIFLKNYKLDEYLGLWYQSMINARNLVTKSKSNRYITDNHWIKLFDKSILNEIEEKYPKNFEITRSLKNKNTVTNEQTNNVICTVSLFYNYLVYVKKFKYKYCKELNVIELHSLCSRQYQSGHKLHKIFNMIISYISLFYIFTSFIIKQMRNESILKKYYYLFYLISILSILISYPLININLIKTKFILKKSKSKWMLNAQGDGISDEYPKCEHIRKIFYSFLENEFPKKSIYEK
jgi:hypothetical protein